MQVVADDDDAVFFKFYFMWIGYVYVIAKGEELEKKIEVNSSKNRL